MANTFDCTIPALAEAYPALQKLDQVDSQSLTVLLLAAILRELGGTDYTTDICALADSLRQYDGMPDYKLNAARMAALANFAQAVGLTLEDVESINVLGSIACGHCCGVTKNSMRNAETVLWCLIANNYSRQ